MLLLMTLLVSAIPCPPRRGHVGEKIQDGSGIDAQHMLLMQHMQLCISSACSTGMLNVSIPAYTTHWKPTHHRGAMSFSTTTAAAAAAAPSPKQCCMHAANAIMQS